jgi:hypothetical protein
MSYLSTSRWNTMLHQANGRTLCCLMNTFVNQCPFLLLDFTSFGHKCVSDCGGIMFKMLLTHCAKRHGRKIWDEISSFLQGPSMSVPGSTDIWTWTTWFRVLIITIWNYAVPNLVLSNPLPDECLVIQNKSTRERPNWLSKMRSSYNCDRILSSINVATVNLWCVCCTSHVLYFALSWPEKQAEMVVFAQQDARLVLLFLLFYCFTIVGAKGSLLVNVGLRYHFIYQDWYEWAKGRIK